MMPVGVDCELATTPPSSASDSLPMFAYSSDRSVNCFVDPSCEAYAPLLDLIHKEGCANSIVCVPTCMRNGTLRVGTKAVELFH